MFLRGSTASQEIELGPFVDSTDGRTPETGLTIANTDIKIWKHGASAFVNKNSGGATVTGTNGYYIATLDATDTNTVGQLTVEVTVSGALHVKGRFFVLGGNFFDAMTGSDRQQVDVLEIGSNANSASQLASSANLMYHATVSNAGHTPTTTEFEATEITEATANHYVGRRIIFKTGALTGQATRITAYALASGRGHFTVDTLTEAPANGDTFEIV